MTNPDESGEKPSSRVWSEVSGLPRGERGSRLLMVLQAFIDDSGNRPEHGVYVLAGFVSTAERWADFADDWQAALDKTPAVTPEFKWSEAWRMQGAFHPRNGWTEKLRDARLKRLLAVLRKHAMVRVHAAIRHEDFARYIGTHANLTKDAILQSPYITLASRIYVSLVVCLHERGLAGPCDVYFDQQDGLDKALEGKWDAILAAGRAHLNGKYGEIIESPPTFRRSDRFKPLQAADLFAGAIRTSCIKGEHPWPLFGIDRIFGSGMFLSEDDCINSAVKILRGQREWAARYPLGPLKRQT